MFGRGKEGNTSPEEPRYIESDYQLLSFVDPSIGKYVDARAFENLHRIIAELDTGNQVVDIGSGTNCIRGLIILGKANITGVDPAYNWYDYMETGFGDDTIPWGVRGGISDREDFELKLKHSLKKLDMRDYAKGSATFRGERHEKEVAISIIADDANEWLAYQRPNSVDNYVVYRVFPSASAWGQILSTLNEGGLLLSTGYGKLHSFFGENAIFEPNMMGGADIDDTLLPVNGNTNSIGLEVIMQLGDACLYRKIRHLDPDHTKEELLKNL